MRGQTATRKVLAALESQFKIWPEQSIIDVVDGFAIVFDRSAEKFTVAPPHTELRESANGFESRKHWTKHLSSAYRIARDAAKQASMKKPVPVIFKHRHNPKLHFGYATFEAGRLVIRDKKGTQHGKKPPGGAAMIHHWYDAHHWGGTEAEARKYVNAANKALEAHDRAVKAIEKRQGRQLRYLDDMALHQAGVPVVDKGET